MTEYRTILQTTPPSLLVSAGAARAAGEAEVAGVAGESRVAAGAVAAVVAILLSSLPFTVMAAGRRRRVGLVVRRRFLPRLSG